jgi:light-regulated signal transduction histidine kinase (bacteriophytochrome)
MSGGPLPTVNLTNCDREPIHIPGAILPHGALLVLDCAELTVLQAAGDTGRLLGREASELLGRSAAELFGAERADKLGGLCASEALAKPRHLLDPAFRVLDAAPLDASVHRSGDLLIMEFEAAETDGRFAEAPLESVQEMIAGLESCSSLEELCQTAAERVKRVAGYDRVMVYRFLPDGSGWVFAEAREDRLVSFLDLHYPAADIPAQARELYRRNWLRLITQIDYEPAPLIPVMNPRTGAPLDMSQATLRDVSPIHREYLRNMGVAASMSISILSQGKLWGLIACHHYGPRILPRRLRAVCELFGMIFSLQVESRERDDSLEARLKSRSILQDMLRSMSEESDYFGGLLKQSERLLAYMDSPGVALRGGFEGGIAFRGPDKIAAFGATPGEAEVAALSEWLIERMDGEGVFATDRLSEVWPRAAAFATVGSGLLAISISPQPRDLILWFRPEVIETVKWGGDPTKPVQVGPNGDRLMPRNSFEAWKQEVRNRATPWSSSNLDAAADLRLALLEIVIRRIDEAAREREKVRQREALLMSELDHRVKNSLANIQALVIATSRTATSLAGFVSSLQARIGALAKAHNLLTQSRWEGASIRSLVRDELEPHMADGSIVIADDPDVDLTPKATLSMSLALHELATNAAKYGSLSEPGGRVLLSWKPVEDGRLELLWREVGGPPVQPPTSKGFGSTLIERALAMQTGGRARLSFAEDGLRCEIVLPATEINQPRPSRSD